MAGVLGAGPSGVFGKYRVALSSTLSRIGIFTAHRRSYSALAGGDSFGDAEGAGGGVCANRGSARAPRANESSREVSSAAIQPKQSQINKEFFLAVAADYF